MVSWTLLIIFHDGTAGHVGTNQAQCEGSGCCWVPSKVSNKLCLEVTKFTNKCSFSLSLGLKYSMVLL